MRLPAWSDGDGVAGYNRINRRQRGREQRPCITATAPSPCISAPAAGSCGRQRGGRYEEEEIYEREGLPFSSERHGRREEEAWWCGRPFCLPGTVSPSRSGCVRAGERERIGCGGELERWGRMRHWREVPPALGGDVAPARGEEAALEGGVAWGFFSS